MLPATHPLYFPIAAASPTFPVLPVRPRGGLVLRRATAAVPTPVEDETPPTLLGQSINGLSAIGNFLDMPGSMVRDTLAGRNPFDQLATPFSDVNRTSGRDLLRDYNLAGNTDTWGNFAGGLATEIALDPFTYPLRWLGMSTKAGAARVSKLKLAGKAGKAALDPTTLGGAVLDLGMQAVPQSLKNAVANSRPGRFVRDVGERTNRLKNQLFDATVMGRSSKEVQAASRELYAANEAAEQGVNAVTMPTAMELKARGMLDPEIAKAQRDLLEGVQGAGMGPHYDRVSKQVLDTFGEEGRAGLALMEAHAKLWGEKTGKNADDWFERIGEVRKSNPEDVGAGVGETLLQAPPKNLSQPINKAVETLRKAGVSDQDIGQQLTQLAVDSGAGFKLKLEPGQIDKRLGKTAEAMRSAVAEMQAAGMSEKKIRQSLIEAIEGSGAKFNPKQIPFEDSKADSLLDLMRSLDPRAGRGALVSSVELRKASGLSREAFDKQMLSSTFALFELGLVRDWG